MFPAVVLCAVVLWLALLQLLLLRGVALLHLLGLLLVALLHLLLLRFVCTLLLGSLVLRLLLLLELLVLLVLFCNQLVLLLLIFLIELCVSGIGRGRRLVGLYLVCMAKVRWVRFCVGAIGWWAIGWWVIGCSGFVSRDDVMAAKLGGSRGCGDWGLALICRSAELWVGACCLEVLLLSGDGCDVPFALCGLFL